MTGRTGPSEAAIHRDDPVVLLSASFSDEKRKRCQYFFQTVLFIKSVTLLYLMSPRRTRGRRSGEENCQTKRRILCYIYDHEDGVETAEIYAFCRTRLNIHEHSGILNNHLHPLEEKRYIRSEWRADNSIYWRPNVDIETIQNIWMDDETIWHKVPSIDDIWAFTSTNAMRSFIRHTVLPDFKESPVSRLEHWKDLYSRLPSREQLSGDEGSDGIPWAELDDLICWAHQVAPCLISHHFDRQRDLVLFATFALAGLFEHHDISSIWRDKGMHGVTFLVDSVTRANSSFGSKCGRRNPKVSRELVLLATVYLSLIATRARFGGAHGLPASSDRFRQLERFLDSGLRTLDPDVGAEFATGMYNISVVIGTLHSSRDSEERTRDPRIFLVNV